VTARDRRRHYRLTYYCEATLAGLDVGRLPCRLADIGPGGAFVEARTVLPVGACTNLRFELAGRDVAVESEVCYSAPGIGMGVRFKDLPELERAHIQTFIIQQAKRLGHAASSGAVPRL